MAKRLTNKDIEDGKKISEIFANLSEVSKSMIIAYTSALRDKEVAERKESEEGER